MYRRLNLKNSEKEILDQIRDASYETLIQGKDNNGIPFLKHIFELHLKIFREACSNCPDKVPGYIQKLKKLNPIEMENQEKKTSEFELQDGVIIPVQGTSEVFSAHNLTDEAAVELLAQNPNRKALFSKMSDNVDELIEAFLANSIEVNEDDDNTDDGLVKVGDNKITIEEAISLLEKVKITTKATTVKGVETKIAALEGESKTEFETLVVDFVAKK